MKKLCLIALSAFILASCAAPSAPQSASTSSSQLAALSKQEGFVYLAESGKIKVVQTGEGENAVATLFALNDAEEPVRRALPINEIRDAVRASGCDLPSSIAVTTTTSNDIVAQEVGVIC